MATNSRGLLTKLVSRSEGKCVKNVNANEAFPCQYDGPKYWLEPMKKATFWGFQLELVYSVLRPFLNLTTNFKENRESKRRLVLSF